MNSELIKRIILWPQIRKWKIVYTHYRVSKFCRRLIEDYYETKPAFDINVKKNISCKKIIWQYWSQGFDSRNLPEIVQFCLNSVEKTSAECGYKLIKISDDNISDYIDLPEFVVRNRSKYPKAHFSDLLRCLLLRSYGGCWLDATVYLTGKIPEKYWDDDFFMYQRDDNEIRKEYWENAFAYYYGWYKGFKVRVLNSIFFCKKDNNIISDLTNILLMFWNRGGNLPDYFLFQILFNELLEGRYKNSNCRIESDCIPHYLQQFINDEQFDMCSLQEILSLSNIHKLTYKGNVNASKVKGLLANGK